MKGYILQGLDRVDFQLSSQAIMIDDSQKAEEYLSILSKEYTNVQWTITNFETLKNDLEKDGNESFLVLTNSSLPYKNFFESTYPNLIIIDIEEKEKRFIYNSRYENIMIITIIITYLILFLQSIF
ncbi:hypothetical protein JZO79_11610 [Vagococcus fluvialis]|uniref:hypothetical protein n=1 Tax=Vagococcus fluvialis TaxID=2738 RepID=UPI001A8CED5F|nr:hypothetical protein [Vagococcus fluvialis]MBO0444259.1 hypothetical protein [Vagococcus fluvialis]